MQSESKILVWYCLMDGNTKQIFAKFNLFKIDARSDHIAQLESINRILFLKIICSEF